MSDGGKGDARRPGAGYAENFDRIFGGEKAEADKQPWCLPCPFCGSEKLEVEMWDHTKRHVACGDCFAWGGSGDTAAEAIAAWNKRK